MKNKDQNGQKITASGTKHRSLIGIITIGLILVTVLTVLSIQRGQSAASGGAGKEKGAQVTDPNAKPYVTLDEKGEPVVLDRESGKSRALTQDESKRLADGLRQVINNSQDGLVEVSNKDGSVSIDLKGHFHDVMVARKEEDGSVSTSCIDNLEAAAGFFEIDPKLLDIDKPVAPFRQVNKTEDR